MIFVNLPAPEENDNLNVMSTFWGLKDNGTYAESIFHSYTAVTNMVLFELDAAERIPAVSDLTKRTRPKKLQETNIEQNAPNAGSQLWVSLDDGKICAVERDGNFSKVLDLPAMLKADLKITSKILTVRSRLYEEDTLIFGIKVTNSTIGFKSFLVSHGVIQMNTTAFLVAIDTPLNAGVDQFPVLWLVPTPDDTVVTGQIVGVPGTDKRLDQLIYFAQKDGYFAKIVSIV